MAYPIMPYSSDIVPLGSVYVPGGGAAALQPLRGANTYTDGASNTSAGGVLYNAGGFLPTYAYTLVQAAPYAVPTDLITLQGSASKIIRVTRVMLSGVATAAGFMLYNLIKRTAANTAGTSSSQSATIVKYDSAAGAAAATISLYTVIPTGLGTGITLQGGRIYFSPLAAPVSLDQTARVEWGIRPASPLILRSATEWLAINFGGSTLPSGGLVDVLIEWTEE